MSQPVTESVCIQHPADSLMLCTACHYFAWKRQGNPLAYEAVFEIRDLQLQDREKSAQISVTQGLLDRRAFTHFLGIGRIPSYTITYVFIRNYNLGYPSGILAYPSYS